jgi:hypothetical protein
MPRLLPGQLVSEPASDNLLSGRHADKINIAVHLVFVPIIFWTFQVWFTQAWPAPTSGPLSNLTHDFDLGLGIPMRFEASGGFWLCLVYAAYYACLEPVALVSHIPIRRPRLASGPVLMSVFAVPSSSRLLTSL